MSSDASSREVFRGDLAAVELAAGLLEEQGIAYQRRWEQAGGTAFTVGETALVPGRTAVLLVPSIAYEEAREVLAPFGDTEPDYLNDLSEDVREQRDRRRTFAKVVAFIVLAPIALWVAGLIVALVYAAFE